MAGRLKGKTAFITGAAQGIGASMVSIFAREGAMVIAADLQVDKVAALAGERIAPIGLDVTDAAAIHAAAAKYPEVSVLVNCAGLVVSGTILDATIEDMRRSFEVNVASMFHTIKAFLPAMLERREGSIINFASVVSSTRGYANRLAYGTSKGAVIALTKSVARDFIDSGVRCNCISPGTTLTPSLEHRMAALGDLDEAMKTFMARQPSGRLGQPDELANVALMLASDEARFLTGADLIVDGGMSL